MLKIHNYILILVSLLIITPALSMVDFKDGDNWPWSQTTNDAPDSEVGGFYINLGMTGARAKVTESNLRVLEVMYIFSNTPADGKLQVGDLITGANGKAFQTDLKNGYGMDKFGGDGPYMDLGNALEESHGGDGTLTLDIKRGGQNRTVALDIGTVYGKYSSTFPFDCPKSDRILNELYAFIAGKQNSSGTWGASHVSWLAAMALLASGDPQYHPNVKKAAEWFGSNTDANIDDEMHGLTVWKNAYGGILLSEYYLATSEAWVIPELEEIKTWLLDAQFKDMSQQADPTTHGPADERQLGGWGHNPHHEGYGPINFQTGQALTALSLMTRCGISVDPDRIRAGYENLDRGAADNGYSWYQWSDYPASSDYADMGRTGASAVANYLAPFSESKYRERAELHARCIGYDNRYKSFPDTHGSPHLGMAFTAMGARLDRQAYLNLMDYHRWWFSLTQSHEGNQFVDQPNRDAGGSYDNNTRVASSATAALVLAAKNRTLYMSGLEEADTQVQENPSTGNFFTSLRFTSFSRGKIEFALPHESSYHISIYNLKGDQYSISGHGKPGINTAALDGRSLPQGMYYLQLRAGGQVVTGKYSLIMMD